MSKILNDITRLIAVSYVFFMLKNFGLKKTLVEIITIIIVSLSFSFLIYLFKKITKLKL